MKKSPSTALLILLVILGVYFYSNSTNDANDLPSPNSTNTSGSDVMTANNDLSSILEDVSGGTSSGTASISREDGMLTHSATATLPEPAGSNFYEGWLVQTQPLKFISTGKMIKESTGEYSLSYSDSDTYDNYNFVVITIETIADDIPEKHILEGLAK